MPESNENIHFKFLNFKKQNMRGDILFLISLLRKGKMAMAHSPFVPERRFMKNQLSAN